MFAQVPTWVKAILISFSLREESEESKEVSECGVHHLIPETGNEAWRAETSRIDFDGPQMIWDARMAVRQGVQFKSCNDPRGVIAQNYQLIPFPQN